MASTLPLAMNFITVPVVQPMDCREVLGPLNKGIGISRTIVDGYSRFVILLRSDAGETLIAFLDEDDLDAFADNLADEVNAAREDGSSGLGSTA